MLKVQRLLKQLRQGTVRTQIRYTSDAQTAYSITPEKLPILKRYPLAANLTIGISFSALGDILEQVLENYKKNKPIYHLDQTRTIKFSSAGVSVGFICHYWYIFLDKRFSELNWKNVLKKIVLCQCVHSPLCIVAFFFSIGFINGWSRSEIMKNIYNKGMTLYQAEWLVWPPALLFSFYFLSTHSRVLFDCIVSLGFDIFNSYLLYNDDDDVPDTEKKIKKAANNRKFE